VAKTVQRVKERIIMQSAEVEDKGSESEVNGKGDESDDDGIVQSGKSSHTLSLNTVVRSLSYLLFYFSYKESLKNVLLIFVKMYGGIRCIQGMNKILTPLFFVFQSDPDDKIDVWSKRLFVPKVLSALHSTADS